MRIAVIGGVGSTAVLLQALARHGACEVAVWGYRPTDTSRVSGWVDLGPMAAASGFSFEPFKKVADCEAAVAAFDPDFLFAVGLSQIVPQGMIKLARRAAIGFHPTALPRGRGRAAIAWLVLEQEDGAATFFALRDGVDDGPIYAQERFAVGPTDDATSVEAKILDAEAKALDRLLPALRDGTAQAVEQDHRAATWYGYRGPEDGRIDWTHDAQSIVRLVRAATHPHPGAFCSLPGGRLKVWKADVVDRPYRGAVGRILEIDDSTILVQAGNGLVRITDWALDGGDVLRPGFRLERDFESEIDNLRRRVEELEKAVLVVGGTKS